MIHPTMPDRGAGRGARAGAYLVATRHVLMAQDIAMTVAEFAPGAAVLVAATPDEALDAVEGQARIALAFVAADPREFAGSALAGAIARRGGRAVLIGEAAEAHGPRLGFRVLQRPFTSREVLGHLAAREDADVA